VTENLGDGGEVEIEGAGIDIGEDGVGASAQYATGRGEKGKRRGEDGLAGRVADSSGREGEPEGIGAGGAADGGADRAEGSDGGFELDNLFAENELLAVADSLEGSKYLRSEGDILTPKVDDWDRRTGVGDHNAGWVNGRGHGRGNRSIRREQL
jgi:hypothetical protein